MLGPPLVEKLHFQCNFTLVYLSAVVRSVAVFALLLFFCFRIVHHDVESAVEVDGTLHDA